MDEIMKIKHEMAQLGWDIEEEIMGNSWRNKTGYHIWFRRSDWHGKFTYSLTGHEVVFNGFTPNINDYEAIMKTIKKTADKSKKAWNDFPDSIPYQNAKGEIRKDIMFHPFEQGRNIKKSIEKN